MAPGREAACDYCHRNYRHRLADIVRPVTVVWLQWSKAACNYSHRYYRHRLAAIVRPATVVWLQWRKVVISTLYDYSCDDYSRKPPFSIYSHMYIRNHSNIKLRWLNIYIYMCIFAPIVIQSCAAYSSKPYGVASVSRLLKITGLFCKRAL